MKNKLNKTITLNELLGYCKKIDEGGESRWLDPEFEGQHVFEKIYFEIFGEIFLLKIAINILDIKYI